MSTLPTRAPPQRIWRARAMWWRGCRRAFRARRGLKGEEVPGAWAPALPPPPPVRRREGTRVGGLHTLPAHAGEGGVRTGRVGQYIIQIQYCININTVLYIIHSTLVLYYTAFPPYFFGPMVPISALAASPVRSEHSKVNILKFTHRHQSH